MSLVSMFLKQTCLWYKRKDSNIWGEQVLATNPSFAPVEIPCRWISKSVWTDKTMGPSNMAAPYLSRWREIYVDDEVEVGDVLEFAGAKYQVVAVDVYVGMSGTNEGRCCYA